MHSFDLHNYQFYQTWYYAAFLSEFAADEEHRVEVISFAPKELELSYENVPIPKGTEIQTTGAAVTLEPSEKIGSTDYGEFYKE